MTMDADLLGTHAQVDRGRRQIGVRWSNTYYKKAEKTRIYMAYGHLTKVKTT